MQSAMELFLFERNTDGVTRSFCSLDSIILQAQLLEKQNLFTGVLSTIVPLSSRPDRSSDEKKNTISISSLPISAYYYPKKS